MFQIYYEKRVDGIAIRKKVKPAAIFEKGQEAIDFASKLETIYNDRNKEMPTKFIVVWIGDKIRRNGRLKGV